MFKSILRLLCTILIAFAFAFVLITCVGERTKVSGHSMEPHLHDHDQVLLDKLTYRFRDPKRYEIIVFPGPEGGDQFFVKRVIALPGETVKITKGKVYVNDKEVKDYSKDHTTDSCELKGKFHLSSDEYFVLGDNPRCSPRVGASWKNSWIICFSNVPFCGIMMSKLDSYAHLAYKR